MTTRTDEPEMIEKCLCGINAALPFDRDGDGIGEECRRCGEYISYQAKPEDEE